uniref:Zinc finger protein 800a n=1 Tax=Tetraodon nigroviridis TaxID=99883 RepID=H3BVQ9_TETNG
VEPGDPPLLQQPLQTSKSGIQQIIECFRSGTAQLKHMLLREVDTIFECKLCRSLFRGLPNLITHKEYYCLTRLPEYDGSAGDDRQSVAMKDLLDAIYPRSDKADYVVRLEPIQTSTKAVFQYISTEEELARYPSHTPRESPVTCEGETVEAPEDNQPNQQAAAESRESHGSPGQYRGGRRWEAEEESKAEPTQHEDEGSTSGVGHPRLRQHVGPNALLTSLLSIEVEDVTISCCLCGQDFNSRRSIRRHCRKMHQTKLEELRKFTETRTVPTSLLSMVKGRPRTLSTPTGKSCPVCLKSFATKANVRRHFDEVHRGLRRDTITPSIASQPGPPFSPEATPPSQNQAKGPSQVFAASQASPASCRCTLCKRNYSSQLISMLKRHMRIVHKVYSLKSNSPKAAPSLPPSSSRGSNAPASGASSKMSKLSVGFDFKQLYCKLCKRQFSSRQNLTKHIELHTDGNDIFIKFYRCPLCRYESRRKRDVLRHVTVVHKKSSAYLAKIMPKLESRAVKRLAEVVLSSTSATVTRKQEGSAATPSASAACSSSSQVPSTATRKQQDPSSPTVPASTPVTRKQERQQTQLHRPLSPPLTRRSEKHQRSCSRAASPGAHTPHTRRHDAQSDGGGTSSTEVRVTKNFSLHACDQCGRAFAKKLYLESHKRSHRNAPTAAANRRKGVSTRSKTLA